MSDVETVVIGGGIVGLAIARSLALRGTTPLVLERNARCGMEISARNSEVLHAGIYYPQGSLRARLCVSGRAMMTRFARDHGVAVQPWGKLLVATRASEAAALSRLLENGRANGVEDLQPLDAAAARRLEPELKCAAAVLSPATGVIDSHGLVQALEGHFTALGGTVVGGTEVTAVRPVGDGYRIATRTVSPTPPGSAKGEMQDHVLTARQVVVACGLGGSALMGRTTFPAPYEPPRTYPAKGHYFALSGASPFRHLVYPMPDGAWLGIHLTLDIAGRAKFGPDLAWCDAIDYAFEDADGAREATFVREIRRYWPGLPDGALAPAYTGIRPKIYPQGAPARDFAIHGEGEHGLSGLVLLFGIESPGLTASLAIGEYVAEMLRARGL